MKKFKLTQGFTIIELIIVIAVLAVLFVALLTVVSPTEQFKKARDSERKLELSQLQKALESYFQDHGKYPDSQSYKIVNGATTLNWGDNWQPYIDKLPKDPSSNAYAYYSPPASNGQAYYLYASLERGNYDSSACNHGSACSSLPNGSGNACVGVCNFGVSSPNVKP